MGASRGIDGFRSASGSEIAWTSQSSTRPQLQIATRPPLRITRRASARAATKSAANWKALNPVTTSKLSSGQGSRSMAPQPSVATLHAGPSVVAVVRSEALMWPGPFQRTGVFDDRAGDGLPVRSIDAVARAFEAQ